MKRTNRILRYKNVCVCLCVPVAKRYATTEWQLFILCFSFEKKKKKIHFDYIEFYKHLNWNEPSSDWLTDWVGAIRTSAKRINQIGSNEVACVAQKVAISSCIVVDRRRSSIVVIVAQFESLNEYVNFVRVNHRHRRPAGRQAAAVATNLNNNNEVNKSRLNAQVETIRRNNNNNKNTKSTEHRTY